MYLEFFGLRELPFQLTPDPDFFYTGACHAQAKACLDYSVWSQDGIVVITGEPGCGKTVLIRHWLTGLGDEFNIARLFQTQLDDKEFLQAVLLEFGFDLFNAGKVELLDTLNTFLIGQYLGGKRTLLVIDEAQDLSARALEELRLLAGLEAQKERILRVVLVGRPRLMEMLESPALGQLAQSVRLHCHLRPLTEVEMAQYIHHRVHVAGAADEHLFQPDCMATLYRFSGGVPQLVNILCDTALMVAFADGATEVDAQVVETAAAELHWAPHAERIDRRIQRAAESDVRQVDRVGQNVQAMTEANAALARLESALPLLSEHLVDRVSNITAELRALSDKLAGK